MWEFNNWNYLFTTPNRVGIIENKENAICYWRGLLVKTVNLLLFKRSVQYTVAYMKNLLGKFGTQVCFKLNQSTLSNLTLTTFILLIIKTSFYMTFKTSKTSPLLAAAVVSVHTHSPHGNDKVFTVSMLKQKYCVYFTNYSKSGAFMRAALERSHFPPLLQPHFRGKPKPVL